MYQLFKELITEDDLKMQFIMEKICLDVFCEHLKSSFHKCKKDQYSELQVEATCERFQHLLEEKKNIEKTIKFLSHKELKTACRNLKEKGMRWRK